MKPRDRFEALRRHRRAGEGLALLLFLLLSLIAHRSTLFAGRIDPGAGAPGGQQEVARLGGIPSYLARGCSAASFRRRSWRRSSRSTPCCTR